jgi:hypothetical protein
VQYKVEEELKRGPGGADLLTCDSAGCGLHFELRDVKRFLSKGRAAGSVEVQKRPAQRNLWTAICRVGFRRADGCLMSVSASLICVNPRPLNQDCSNLRPADDVCSPIGRLKRYSGLGGGTRIARAHAARFRYSLLHGARERV